VGCRNGWQEHSTAMLTGYLSEWVVLESFTANQKFNASDGCPIPINRLWPELARWYGISDSDVGRPETDDSKYTVVDPGNVKTPLGYGPPTKAKFSFTLSEWATRPENAKAWKEIMEKEGVTHDPFEDVEAHFTFGDAAAWGLALCLSTAKQRSVPSHPSFVSRHSCAWGHPREYMLTCELAQVLWIHGVC
jgi:hypothetical protein